MGRKRQSRLDLPERVYFHHGAYYFVHASGRWEMLDRDYAKAMARWAEIIQLPERAETVGDLLDRYVREVVPGKAARTQKDNLVEIRFLRTFFGAMDIGAVKPTDVVAYRDARAAKTRCNRELALLSHAYSLAVEWGLAAGNPCRDVRRNKEVPRDRYVTDAELEKFKEDCPPWLKTYLSIKLLTGLRQQDLLAIRWTDVTDSSLSVRTQKTGQRLSISLTSELSSLINSLPKLGDTCFCTRQGKVYSASGFASIWNRLMKKFTSSGNSRFHEHDIRGKTATDMDDPVAAQRLLGHSSIAMTEAYIKQRQTDVVQPLRRTK
jgi:integrase